MFSKNTTIAHNPNSLDSCCYQVEKCLLPCVSGKDAVKLWVKSLFHESARGMRELLVPMPLKYVELPSGLKGVAVLEA